MKNACNSKKQPHFGCFFELQAGFHRFGDVAIGGAVQEAPRPDDGIVALLLCHLGDDGGHPFIGLSHVRPFVSAEFLPVFLDQRRQICTGEAL